MARRVPFATLAYAVEELMTSKNTRERPTLVVAAMMGWFSMLVKQPVLSDCPIYQTMDSARVIHHMSIVCLLICWHKHFFV